MLNIVELLLLGVYRTQVCIWSNKNKKIRDLWRDGENMGGTYSRTN